MEAKALLPYDDYTVGWIYTLPVEMAAAMLMFDKAHLLLPRQPMDQKTYVLGRTGGHNITIASLSSGAYGNTSATSVAMQLLSSFHAVAWV